MKGKLKPEEIKQIFIENTYNNVSQAELAKRYGVSQGNVSLSLKYYALDALKFDVNSPDLSDEDKSKKLGLTKDQYAMLVFKGRSKLMG